MKKLFSSLFLVSFMVISIGQTVSDCDYKFNNGIVVKTDRCWEQVWIQQSYSALAAGDNKPLAVSIRTMGDLTSGSSFKLLNNGKEVNLKGAAPGTYDLKMSFNLSGNTGSLGFVANKIIIKPKSKTTVTVTLYNYLISISEAKGTGDGLANFDSKVITYKNCIDPNTNQAIPTFYMKGKDDNSVTPDQMTSKTSGKIKPGVYDVLVTLDLSGRKQKIWLQNFNMKPDVSYKILTNLNAGEVIYKGGDKDIKSMHFYSAGTAAKQSGTPSPIKNLELFANEDITSTNACPPGSYDVLLESKKGDKFEWRKNVIVKTSTRTEVK